MFDTQSGYEFKYEGCSPSLEGMPRKIHRYTFLNREGYSYTVLVDEFDDCHLFGIKYFRNDYYDTKEQYSIILNTYDYKNVIATILNIIVHIYKEQTFASFVFQGAACEGESENNTQRFRVWLLLAKNFFPKTIFDFKDHINKSVVVLRNKSCTKKVIETIDDILKNHGVIF